MSDPSDNQLRAEDVIMSFCTNLNNINKEIYGALKWEPSIEDIDDEHKAIEIKMAFSKLRTLQDKFRELYAEALTI